MKTVKDYLASQFNGERIKAFLQAPLNILYSYDDTLTMWANLSLPTAKGEYLDFIGQLLGYVRPLVSEDYNWFKVDTLPDQLDGMKHGLSSLTQRDLGGLLGTNNLNIQVGSYIDDGLYRNLLLVVARLRHTTSITDIDFFCSVLLKDVKYSIAWTEPNHDINIRVPINSIALAYLDIYNNILEQYFVSAPKVRIVTQSE